MLSWIGHKLIPNSRTAQVGGYFVLTRPRTVIMPVTILRSITFAHLPHPNPMRPGA
jgi:hypothetical protein